MDLSKFLAREGEKPLDTLVQNGGFCGIFRKIACIGDSLSSGEFESMTDGKKGFHDYYDYSWGQYLARDAGCTVYNFSKGGMTAKAYMESFAEKQGFFAKDLAAQAYIIALGVNDVSRILEGEQVFGDIADIHPDAPEQNADSFAGHYGAIISQYKALQPKAKFFLMTMPSHHDKDERGMLYDRHAALLHEIATLFEGCYVLDLRQYGPDYNEEFKQHFYLGGHMSAAGYRLTALMVESYIDYLIRHNPDDFRQVGFVGTPYHNVSYKW